MEEIKYNRIAEVLAEKRKSQLWLAQKRKVSPEAVSNWCTQKNQPSFANLFGIADDLEIDVRQLLEPNEKSPRKDFKF